VERTVSVLIKAATAGINGILSLRTFHDNCRFAAVIIRIMQATGYITVQFCHIYFLLEFLLRFSFRRYYALWERKIFSKIVPLPQNGT
jgi:hypothetical protein